MLVSEGWNARLGCPDVITIVEMLISSGKKRWKTRGFLTVVIIGDLIWHWCSHYRFVVNGSSGNSQDGTTNGVCDWYHQRVGSLILWISQHKILILLVWCSFLQRSRLAVFQSCLFFAIWYTRPYPVVGWCYRICKMSERVDMHRGMRNLFSASYSLIMPKLFTDWPHFLHFSSLIEEFFLDTIMLFNGKKYIFI